LRTLWVRGGACACALASAGLLRTAIPLASSLNPFFVYLFCAYAHRCTFDADPIFSFSNFLLLRLNDKECFAFSAARLETLHPHRRVNAERIVGSFQARVWRKIDITFPNAGSIPHAGDPGEFNATFAVAFAVVVAMNGAEVDAAIPVPGMESVVALRG